LGPVPEFGLDISNASEATGISALPVSAAGTRGLDTQGATVIIEQVGSKGLDVPALPEVPVPRGEVEPQTPRAPLNVPQVPALGIPMDGTGQMLLPGTPPKRAGKRKAVLRQGQKVIRKGRGLVLKRPVLTVVVGRQLSGPTADALKMISKGVPVDVGDLPVRAPVPAPGVPA
jgi:hypothetical protein